MISRIFLAVVGVAVGDAAPAASPPSAVLDLNGWKLTLPYDTERKGNPDEVVHPELATFEDESCFFTAPSGEAVVFRASCDGSGTVNSKYPRSELREMKPGGKDEIGWGTDDGSLHVMELDLAVTHTPDTKPHVVCAQIHDEDDDVIMVRIEGEKTLIERKGDSDLKVRSDYQLGDRFKLRIEAGGGRVRVFYNGELQMDWAALKKGCYFKAGCYTQSNRDQEDSSGSYGEVEIYRIQVTHEPNGVRSKSALAN
ncbi:Alginate lyase precursor [Pirellulimonas nuda]|uniref:Alginate lyase n=1 Tax=Pirellulimonas nuda TaxID=2528009 RepID=A0A518DAC6_9BACT|nr:polysaccharide lyase family 7 protein [Pirellulimonas nuda]QDU88434.1 Alginate lyase precursor [Pirellulimonas nuda]